MTARTPSFPAASAACQPGARFRQAEGGAKHGRASHFALKGKNNGTANHSN